MQKPSVFYKYNKILEIILFGVSVLIINILLSEKLYWWTLVATTVITFLEIVLKNDQYNFILNAAKKREEKSESLERNGITGHYFMNDTESKNKRNSVIANEINVANEMNLIAETGKSYLDIPTDRHWKNVKQKLDKGLHFRVLLIDPYCENKKIRNKLNGVDQTDRKLDQINLLSLNSKYDNLEIRFTNQPYCSLFFTDKYMIYDPYHLGKTADRIENNFIAIEFRNDNPNYNILKSHFNNCWTLSRPLEEVIKNDK